LGGTPEELVFGKDIFLPIEYRADWDVITQWKQHRIDQSNTRENSTRIDIVFRRRKCSSQQTGNPSVTRYTMGRPLATYRIETLHDNGTVTISKGIAVTDWVNLLTSGDFNLILNTLIMMSEF